MNIVETSLIGTLVSIANLANYDLTYTIATVIEAEIRQCTVYGALLIEA
ncbi:hypothetical protein [Leptospira sarikeiensis]|nr:hypothetical protein [Leptospira sarikeiensis]